LILGFLFASHYPHGWLPAKISFTHPIAIEIAWGWLRHQPESELTLWYHKRFGQGSKRLRKIGIVALARKLLIALWRYLDYGEIPAGALLKTT